MTTGTYKDAGGLTRTVEEPNANGRAAAAASRPVALSIEDLAALTAIVDRLTAISGNVDGLETLLTALGGFVDGLEGLQGTANTSLGSLATLITALNGYVDGLEALEAGVGAKLPASLGSKTAAASLSVVPAGLEFETVAASATDQVMGGTGAAGDYLSHFLIQPLTLSPGAVTIKSGSTTVHIFPGGPLADLRPVPVPIGAFSLGGGWSITTGANVTAVAFGDFT